MSIASISPQRLHDMVQAGQSVELIDVRTPLEYRVVHISFARNVPLHRLDAATLAAGPNGAKRPLYVVCQAGARGKQACELLLAAGYPNVVNVEGGTQAWLDAALPVVRGQKAISLERQVRIAAGALVLIGALLGYFAHPYWIALAAFVGAGLLFAGITDACGMGMLLAKMPWNQVHHEDATLPQSSSCGAGGCS
jgi:rhodanese-related sulfurtransferase